MHDDLKPRRPRWEEELEIRDFRTRAELDADSRFLRELERPPGQALLLEAELQEMEDEREQREEERWETESERAESERILKAEAEIAIDIPIRRARELGRTFASSSRREFFARV